MDLSLKIMVLTMVVQVALTLWVFWRMGVERTKVLKSGALHIRDIALGNDAWPDHIKKLQNNLQNQFETPMLFYVAILTAASLSLNNWFMAVCAVAYMALRVTHHLIHTRSNHVPSRYKVFVLSLLVLILFWGAILVSLLFS